MNDNFENALNVMFDSDAGKNLSVRGYLLCLLRTLWLEGEGFSGKRPFGNSGWDYELINPLVKAGFVKGEIDEDGYIAWEEGGREFVTDLIEYLFSEEA